MDTEPVNMGELNLPEVEETPDDMKLWCENCSWVGVGLDTKANPGHCPQCNNFWSLTQGEKPEGWRKPTVGELFDAMERYTIEYLMDKK